MTDSSFLPVRDPAYISGPFPAQALSSWKASGVFGGEACENIELRVRGPEGPGEWGSWKSIFEAGS